MDSAIHLSQGSYCSELFKFHDFPWLFPWPFQVFHDLRLSCCFRKFSNFPCLSIFFTKAVQQTQTLVSSVQQNVCRLHCLISCLDLTLFSLALSSVVTYLLYKSLILHDFPRPTIKFHDFPGLENEILKFHDFPGFPWPVQTLFRTTGPMRFV